MTDPVENYLQELFHIRSSGAATKETSYYPVLERLLNNVGKQLKPQVTCIMNIASRGAGLPDGGLFTTDQFHKRMQSGTWPPVLPARGVIEVKGTSDDTWRTAQGDQVTKYWGKYRQILVTNYRDFLLVGQDTKGKAMKPESFRLAENENDFWSASATPRKTSKQIGGRFIEYLKRVMLHLAPLTDPQDVAWFLASYAHEAKDRIENKQLPALAGLRDALEESLGLRFEGKKGEHFFRSTLVQTLFYGIFSAWVIWSRQNNPSEKQARFDWRHAAWLLRIPMVRELFEQIATPSKLGPLQMDEVLDWTEATLNRIDRRAFFEKFEERHAVQYFYEPFLEAFDPLLRKELGVWYTPPEIVEYMVARVNTVLREELGIEDGLADRRVYVLDPAVGTGSYLVEVLRRIASTLKENGGDALVADDLKRAIMERVFGFEILPAPFVVAHLQVGLLLQSLGVQISETKNERLGIYLTNSLTGWGLPEGPQKLLAFPELEKEREESEQVKCVKPILVVLGNPPYNAFAGVSPKEEQGLIEPYKEGVRSEWGIKSFNLDDLYIRFFRLAERRIAEQTGKGVICYISNFSYLRDAQFVVMRKRLLDEFDKIWFDCMNGSSRETGKLTPDGKPDPSVFSSKYNPEGIKVGTAIGLLVRKPERLEQPVIRFRHFWGVMKRQDLLNSLKAKRFDDNYKIVHPSKNDRYSFASSQVPKEYYTWPSVLELGVKHFNGPIERRGNSLIPFILDRGKLEVLRDYLNPNKSNDEIRAIAPRLMKSSGDFKAEETRSLLLRKRVQFDPGKIIRYPFKVMDLRLAYLDSKIQPLFSRPRPELLMIRDIPNNAYLITRDTADKQPEGPPFFFSSLICDYDCISGHARHFPIWVTSSSQKKGKKTKTNRKVESTTNVEQSTLSGESKLAEGARVANFSDPARAYLNTMGIINIDTDQEFAKIIWMHVLAIGFSPSYLAENADGIRLGWPRVPLPRIEKALRASVQLGIQVAALLDLEASISGITSGDIRSELKIIAVISRKSGGSLDPSAGDLRITAGWGHGTDVVMPGSGRALERSYAEEESSKIKEGCEVLGLTNQKALNKLGKMTFDIYLNDIAYWRNIPARVWEYTIGGYQVLKKWLSYREYEVLGRSITPEEAREFTTIARRIAALILLEPSLDANYKNIKNDAYQWSSSE